jgi:FixJ family two-component response regulator
MFRHNDTRPLHDEPTVLAIGCDSATCQTLKAALRPLDLRVEFYPSIDEFLAACDLRRPGCLFLDWDLAQYPQQDVLGRLARGGVHLPVLLLAARGDLSAAVRAVRLGAFHFLSKSSSQQALAAAAEEALQWEAEHHAEILDRLRIQKRLARLNDAERAVLELVVQGMSNEAISSYLGLSVRTVETRRSSLMKKMRAKGLADLLRQAMVACCGARSFFDGRLHLDAVGGGR